MYLYPLLLMCHLSCGGAHQVRPVWLGDWDALGIIIQGVSATCLFQGTAVPQRNTDTEMNHLSCLEVNGVHVWEGWELLSLSCSGFGRERLLTPTCSITIWHVLMYIKVQRIQVIFVRWASGLKLFHATWFRCRENRSKLAIWKFINSDV